MGSLLDIANTRHWSKVLENFANCQLRRTGDVLKKVQKFLENFTSRELRRIVVIVAVISASHPPEKTSIEVDKLTFFPGT